MGDFFSSVEGRTKQVYVDDVPMSDGRMRRLVSIVTVFAFLLICPGMGLMAHASSYGADAEVAVVDDHQGHGPCHEAPEPPAHQNADPCADLSACGAHHWLQSPPSIGPVLQSRLIETLWPANEAPASLSLAPDPFPPKRIS